MPKLNETRIREGRPFMCFIGWEFVFFSFRRRKWLEKYAYRFIRGELSQEPYWAAVRFLD